MNPTTLTICSALNLFVTIIIALASKLVRGSNAEHKGIVFAMCKGGETSMSDNVTQDIKRHATVAAEAGNELLKSKRLRILSIVLLFMTLILAAVSAIDVLVFENPLTLSTFSPLIVLCLAVIVFQVLKQSKR